MSYPSSRLVLTALALLTTTSVMMSFPMISIYMHEYFNASLTDVGAIISLIYFSSFVSRLLVGFATPEKHTALVIALGHIALIISGIGFMIAPNLPIAALLCIALGFGSAAAWTTQMAVVTMVAPPSKAAAEMRNYTLAIGTGLTIGPGLGAVVVSVLDVRWVFMVASVLAVGGLLTDLPLRKILAHTESGSRGDRVPLSQGVRLLLRQGVLIPSVSFGSLATVYSVLAAYAPIYAKRSFSLGESEVFLLFLGFSLVTVLSRLPLSKNFSDRWVKTLLVLSFATASLGLLMVGFGTDLLIFGLGFVLLGVQQGVVLHLGAIIVSASTTVSERVLGNAIYQAGQDVGGLVAPLVASLMVPMLDIPNTLSVFSLVPFAVLILTLISKISAKQMQI
ncbi:MAG: MFS transporter [Thaumarchaeota archaeon]|nr:MFS transporter [Nitrososphaerota archaeon]